MKKCFAHLLFSFWLICQIHIQPTHELLTLDVISATLYEGNRIGLLSNGTAFYYMYHAQGDVVGIANATSGEVVATYKYDAWGNCTVTNANNVTIGTENPFRYRGYYYDTESGLYYLNSRYYSPELGRFINADSLIDNTGTITQNLFSYCGNNPVNYIDPDGHLPKWVSGLLDIASGITQIIAGISLATATAATGVGIAVGVALVANGLTTMYSGIAQVNNHLTGTESMHEENWIRTGAKALGRLVAGEKGQKVAEVVYDVADLAASIYSIGSGANAVIQSTSKIAKTSRICQSACSMVGNSVFNNMYSVQRAMTPIKEYISLPKPWFRITNMIGAGVDTVRTTVGSVIPLFD